MSPNTEPRLALTDHIPESSGLVIRPRCSAIVTVTCSDAVRMPGRNELLSRPEAVLKLKVKIRSVIISCLGRHES